MNWIAIITFCLLPLVDTKKLGELTDSSFHQVFDGSWLIMFYAPWCPACQSLKSPWEQFAEEERTDGLKVAEVDVTKYPALSGQFLIFNLPSIYYIHNGQCRQYYGLHDISSIKSWIEDGKWKSADVISSWRSPNSFVMKSVGRFFHFANEIRVLKSVMTDEYAIPSWIVYVIFVVSTVVIGLLVGLVLVCLCDCMCPPKAEVIELKDDMQYNEADTVDEQDEGDSEEDTPDQLLDADEDGSESGGEGQQVRRRRAAE